MSDRTEARLLAAAWILTAVIVTYATINGQWWLYIAAAGQALTTVPSAVKILRGHPLAWTWHCENLQPEYAGWRRPVWLGSDDWPGEDIDNEPGTYWRSTIAIRIPGKRYLIIAVPIRRKHKEPA